MRADRASPERSCHRRSASVRTSRRPSNEGNGFFPPESMIRKINREVVVLLGGGRAILLQLAHPYVAAGVDDYSNFESDILERLYRTMLFMHSLVFTDRRTAQEALRQFQLIHRRIRGRLRHRAGRFPPGTSYSGTDPHAKLWVHATFVDSSLRAYEQFLGPLSPEERQRYYSDSLCLAQLMRVPEECLPPTLEDFCQYTKRMLAGDTLAVTDTARRLARAVLYPRVGFLPSLSGGLLRFVTAGLLPDRFRREYGLKWSDRRQTILTYMSRSTCVLRPFVPSWVWQTPLQGGKLTRFLLWGKNKPVSRGHEPHGAEIEAS